jgi:hypothetical protein
LPPGALESADNAFVKAPKLRTRRFPTKVMYLGVRIPQPNNAFIGKIMIKCVSKEVLQQKGSFSQKFDDKYTTCHKLKNSDWKDTYNGDANTIVDDLLYDIKLEFDLDEAKFNRMVFSYSTWSITGKTKKVARL